MSKKYIEPEMEIVSMEDVDIIASSTPIINLLDTNSTDPVQIGGNSPVGNGQKTPFIPS